MDQYVQQLAPRIACFVETLLKHGKLGVTGDSARIGDINTGYLPSIFMFSEKLFLPTALLDVDVEIQQAQAKPLSLLLTYTLLIHVPKLPIKLT